MKEIGYCVDDRLPTRNPDETAKFADVTTYFYGQLMKIADTLPAFRDRAIDVRVGDLYAKYFAWASERKNVTFDQGRIRALIAANATKPYETVRAVFLSDCSAAAKRRQDLKFASCESDVFVGLDALGFPTRDQDPWRSERALRRVVELLSAAGFPAAPDPDRGFDHGVFIPLKVAFPDADVPVLQMSLPTQDPGTLIELGRRLRPLREEGVLIVGSGFLTHGLPFLTSFRIDAEAPGWSVEFDAWAAEALARGDVDTLASYQSLAPGMPYAHPTVEHYTPLFVTLGAATTPDEPGIQVIDGFWMGLSKRSLQVA